MTNGYLHANVYQAIEERWPDVIVMSSTVAQLYCNNSSTCYVVILLDSEFTPYPFFATQWLNIGNINKRNA